MIQQANRFHGYGSLRYVYRRGQSARGPVIGLRYVLNKKRDQFRVAVVVSKKISKSAVARNRMRRRIYESVRLLAPAIDQPYDLVLTVFQDSLSQLPTDDLNREVKKLLDQAGVLSHSKAAQRDIIKTNERTTD